MISPMNQTDVLNSLASVFHARFKTLYNERIYSHEDIFCAGNFTTNYEGAGTVQNFAWGFFIITTARCIEVTYSGDYNSKTIWYYGAEPGFFDTMMGKNRSPKTRRIWAIPSQTSHEAIIKTEKIDIGNIWNNFIKKDYSIVHDGLELNLIELFFPPRHSSGEYKVFEASVGERVLSLVDLARQNRGKIPRSSPQIANNDVLALLDSLAQLHQAGILTDEEFQRKKQELLSRL